MAEKRRFFDVWIIESNTVYREVPYDVVADWVQQGRLLDDDKIRPSGTAEWQRVGGMPDFIVYLPKPAPPDAVETPAEPLEPVHSEFGWRGRPEDEDSEVDMIPLIDVSLVLLIFFMITMTDVSGGGSTIDTPPARNAIASTNPDSVWVGIDLIKNDKGDPVKNDKGEPGLVYSLGVGDKTTEAGLPTRAALLARLKALLESRNDPVELTIKANREVRSGEVRQLTVDLQEASFSKQILRKYTGVTEEKKQ